MTEFVAIVFEAPPVGIDAMGKSVYEDIAKMQIRLNDHDLALTAGDVSGETRGREALWGRLASRAAENAGIDLSNPEIQARLGEEREKLRYRDWR